MLFYCFLLSALWLISWTMDGQRTLWSYFCYGLNFAFMLSTYFLPSDLLVLSVSLSFLGQIIIVVITLPQVSPAIILITRVAPDGGMLQSWLFTSRSRNLVSGKLRSSGFWSYSNFFKWNRVKMAKNGQKMVEIFLGGSYMISNNIFSIFCFSTFSLGYFTNPAFWINFKKIALKTGSQKYLREKVEKQKITILLIIK